MGLFGARIVSRLISAGLAAVMLAAIASTASANVVLKSSPTFKTNIRTMAVQHLGAVSSSAPRAFTVILRGRSPADATMVANYFRGYGLQVKESKDHHFLHVVGTFGQTAASGHTNFEHVKVMGEEVIRTVHSPNFPPAIAARVVATSMSPGVRMRSLAIKPRPNAIINGPQTGYGPPLLASVYNIRSVYLSGVDGTGRTIDIAACFNIDPADITFFETFYGLPPNVVNVIPIDGGPVSFSDLEPTLDVERVIGTAPGAKVNLYVVPDCFISEFVDMFAQIAVDGGADAMSVSYGLPEADYGVFGIGDLLLAQNAALQSVSDDGMAIFAASGDSGSWGDPFIALNFLDVLYPASDPNVISAGGTTLETSVIGTRLFEYAWGGSGGGFSGIFTIPPWQAATPGVASGLFKNLPDISFDSDLNTGVATAWLVSFPPPIFPVGGTSAASPTWAGIMALVNQARKLHGHSVPLHDVAAHLYALRGTKAFTDITVGTNGYFPAQKGYDNATGLGVPNVGNLVKALQ